MLDLRILNIASLLSAAVVASSGCTYFRPDASPQATLPGPPTAQTATANGPRPGDTIPASYYESDGPKKKGFELEDLDPFNAPTTIRKITGRGPKRDIAINLYRKAQQKFDEASAARQQDQNASSSYRAAAGSFEEAAARWPDSALEEDALFMTGESYFFADDYPKANNQYEQLIKKYPNTKHIDTAGVRKFSIAKFWVDANRARPDNSFSFNMLDNTRPRRDTRGHGIRVFDRIRLDDPTGKLADDATLAAGNAHFENGRYLEAGEFYEDLIRTFPNSEHQFTAHLLALKSKLASYQGPAYDADPLLKAEGFLTKVRRQFPQEVEEHREYLKRTFAEIHDKKAEREYRSARYYDRRGEYGAARMHYETLASEYSATSYGERAISRLQDIQSKPAVPPDRLKWLARLFPEEENVKPLFSGKGPIPTFR